MKLKISYRTKVLIILLSVVLAVFAISFSFLIYNYKKSTYINATTIVDGTVRENASKIIAELNIDMGVCRSLAYTFASQSSTNTEGDWQAYIKILKEADKQANGYLNVWASFELNAFQKGYTKDYGRRVLNAYRKNGDVIINDYLKNLEGDDIGSTYHNLKHSKLEEIVDPYLYSLSGKQEEEQLVTSICVPILKNDKYIGLAGVDIGLDRYQEITDAIEPFKGSISFLISNDGRILTHNDKQLINVAFTDLDVNVSEKENILKRIQRGVSFSFITKEGKQDLYYSFSPIKVGTSQNYWSLVVVTPMNVILENSARFIKTAILLAVIVLLFLGIFLTVASGKIFGIFTKLTTFSNEINKGNLLAVPNIKGKNEIGALGDALRGMVHSLRAIINQIKTSSKQISEASSLLNNNSQRISHSATRQAAEVEEISAALEQILMFIEQNANDSKSSNQIVIQSKSSVIEGSSASLKATSKMKEIAETNQVVSDIAFQTNILALNAAVEAARAGEHGRGFSVVASEVRKLAERSKDAAIRINDMSQAVVDDSEIAQEKLTKIVPDIEKAALLVQGIASSSSEQSEGVRQINISIHELNTITQDNAMSSESLATSAEELDAQAKQLEALISTFRS